MKPTEEVLRALSIIGTVLLLTSLAPFHAVVGGLEVDSKDPAVGGVRWRETPPIRVIMRSTADWGRIMFDDEMGNNTNGIRFKYVLSYGWLSGNDSDDEISVGKGTWYDVLYNVTVRKTGDIVAFNKQREDFNYTEMYADIVFEIEAGMMSGYIWLMLAGQGITVFQLVNLQHQYTLWQETMSGTGHTRHVRRYIMLDSFFRRWEISPTSIVVLTLIAILMMVLLSPLVPTRRRLRRREGSRRSCHRFAQTLECVLPKVFCHF